MDGAVAAIQSAYARRMGTPLPPARWLARIARHHADGVAFKLHPAAGLSGQSEREENRPFAAAPSLRSPSEPLLDSRSPAGEREALAQRHAQVRELMLEVWLWVESLRLGRFFPSARAYAADPGDKWHALRERPLVAGAVRNLLLNLRAGLPSSAEPGPSPFFSRLLRHPRGVALAELSRLLWEDPSDKAGVERYLRLWRKVQ
jgi:hypothetical protein